MKRPFLRKLLLLAGFAGLIIPAKAQADDQLVVKIPFEFVAAGQTLPAGEYRILRLRDDQPRILILTSLEKRSGSIMLSAVSQETSHGKAQLAFTTAGDQHFLSRIETEDYAYILAVPSADSLVAAARNKASTASSGNN